MMAGYLPTITAFGYSQYRPPSKSPATCPAFYRKVIEIRRSHSYCTHSDNNTFLAVDFRVGEVLGQGFFGQAIKATHVKTGNRVVLKELVSHDEYTENGFRREILLLRSLSHPCLLKYLGVMYREKTLSLITEYMECGTLSNVLLDLTVSLSWTQRISFARDIAAGMWYLHSVGVIHRDLNSHNCLVRQDFTVVVADLGLAKVTSPHNVAGFHCPLEKSNIEEETDEDVVRARRGKRRKVSHQQQGAVVGNPYWMAPEMMLKGVYDEKVDVFSYGIILCETIARVTADPDYLPRSLDFSLNVEAFHQKFCEHAPEPYVMLAVVCSQLESEDRPSFEMVHLMCQSLILHVELAAAVPPDLQGSAVDFSRSLKEKLYGKDYIDIDSCIRVHSRNPKGNPQNVFTNQDHDTQSGNPENNFHDQDTGQVSSNSCVLSPRARKHVCLQTGVTSNVANNTQIQTTKRSSHSTSLLECDNEIVHGTNGQNQLSENSDKETEGTCGTCSLSGSVITDTRPLSTNLRNFTSQSGPNFYSSIRKLYSENRITQFGKNNRFQDSIHKYQNVDDAYFSSSSTSSSSSSSSSCLSLNLSVENDSTRQSSLNGLHSIHKVLCSIT